MKDLRHHREKVQRNILRSSRKEEEAMSLPKQELSTENGVEHSLIQERKHREQEPLLHYAWTPRQSYNHGSF